MRVVIAPPAVLVSVAPASTKLIRLKHRSQAATKAVIHSRPRLGSIKDPNLVQWII
jgi:hypothetical protein